MAMRERDKDLDIYGFLAALMGEHEKASESSNDVMGHLQFVLLNRLDVSKRLIDKLEGKISNNTSKSVNMFSNFSLLSYLVNQLAGENFPYTDRDIGQLVTGSKVFSIEIEKELQKMLYDKAVSLGRNSIWSPSSSNSLFELFTAVERLIEHLDRMDHRVDESEEKINVILPRIMQLISRTSSQISLKENNEEIDDDDDNDDEESDGDYEEEESVEDEDEEENDDGVNGNED